MIRVTVELLPHGSEQRRETLGLIDIVNDGTGDARVGNYDVTLWDHIHGDVQHWRIAEHERDDGWGELLRLVITKGLKEQ